MTSSKSSPAAQHQESALSVQPPPPPRNTNNTATNNEPQPEASLVLTKEISSATVIAVGPAATESNNSTAQADLPGKPLAVAPTLANTGEPTNTKAKTKSKKRSLFGFGKKKMDETHEKQQQQQQQYQQPSRLGIALPDSATPLAKPVPGMSSIRPSTTSPAQLDPPFRTPSSPGRALSASSPRLVSPAGSQIFERDVQESTIIPNSPAIPSHISTENHIPPVLDASSEAITDGHLSPDSVEIITHTQHQAAAATLTGVPSCDNLSAAWEQDLQRDLNSLGEKDDSASNYGSFDTNDIRRLSFISFADVVQAEQAMHPGHQPGSRDSIHLAGLTSLSSMNMNRSPSPMRSPVSSQGGLGTSPPTSKSGSVKGLELSPSRKPLGSPTSTHHTLPVIGSEVSIETMSQALRRTGSADLSGVRSLPTSPIEGPLR